MTNNNYTRNNNQKLIKVLYDNPSIKHVLDNDDIKKMCLIEGSYPFTKLPVCNGCEGLALWHRDEFDNVVGVCTKCHTVSKNPVTYSEYLLEGYDVDSSGKTFRELSELGKTKLAKDRLLYLV